MVTIDSSNQPSWGATNSNPSTGGSSNPAPVIAPVPSSPTPQPTPTTDTRTELQKKMGVQLGGTSSGVDKPGEAAAKMQSIGVTSGAAGYLPPGSVESVKASEAHFVETSKAIQGMLQNPDVVFAKGATQRGFELAAIAKSDYNIESIKAQEYLVNPSQEYNTRGITPKPVYVPSPFGTGNAEYDRQYNAQRDAMAQKDVYAAQWWGGLSLQDKIAIGGNTIARSVLSRPIDIIMSGGFDKAQPFSTLAYDTQSGMKANAQKYGFAGGFGMTLAENEALQVGVGEYIAGGVFGVASKFAPTATKILGYGMGAYGVGDIGYKAATGNIRGAAIEGAGFIASIPFMGMGYKAGAEIKLPSFTMPKVITEFPSGFRDIMMSERASLGKDSEYNRIMAKDFDSMSQKDIDYLSSMVHEGMKWDTTGSQKYNDPDFIQSHNRVITEMGLKIPEGKIPISSESPLWFAERGKSDALAFTAKSGGIVIKQDVPLYEQVRALGHEIGHNIAEEGFSPNHRIAESNAMKFERDYIDTYNKLFEETIPKTLQSDISGAPEWYTAALQDSQKRFFKIDIKSEFKIDKITGTIYDPMQAKAWASRQIYNTQPISLEERYGGLGQFGHDITKPKRRVSLTQLLERPKAAEEKPVDTLDLTSLDKYGSYAQPKGDTMGFLTEQQARVKYTGKTIFDVESAKLQSSQESAKGNDYSAMRKALAKQHQEMISDISYSESKLYGYGEQSLTRAQMKGRLDAKYGTKNIQSSILVSDSASQLKNIQSSESKSMLLAGMMPISKSATKSIQESGMVPISLLKSAAISINDVPQESSTRQIPILILRSDLITSPSITSIPLPFPTIPDIYTPYVPIQPPTVKPQPIPEPPRFESPRIPREPTPEIPRKIIFPSLSFADAFPTRKRKKSSRSEYSWIVDNPLPTAKSLFGKLSKPGKIPRI
jgi:hypothetical protein